MPRRRASELQPGQQLREGVRLGQIVVAAAAQALDPLVDVAHRADEQHRRLLAGGAQRLDHAEPIQLGQHAIDDQHVVFRARRQQQAFLAAVHHLHVVAALLQALGHVAGGIAVVLDDQHVHRSGAPVMPALDLLGHLHKMWAGEPYRRSPAHPGRYDVASGTASNRSLPSRDT